MVIAWFYIFKRTKEFYSALKRFSIIICVVNRLNIVCLESFELRRLPYDVIRLGLYLFLYYAMLFKKKNISIRDIKNAFVLNPANVMRGHSYYS